MNEKEENEFIRFGGEILQRTWGKEAAEQMEGRPPKVQQVINKAVMAEETGDWETAGDLFRYALKLYPNDALTWTSLGFCLEKVEKFDEAEKSYRKAIELAPHSFGFHYNLADLLKKLCRWKDAEKEYTICQQLNPADVGTRRDLEWVRKRMGEAQQKCEEKQAQQSGLISLLAEGKVDEIVKIGEPAVPGLVRVLKWDGSLVRKFRRDDKRKDWGVLVDVFERNHRRSLQPRAARALGKIWGESAVPILIQVLKDKQNEEVRKEVFEVLLKIGEPAVPALAGFLKDEIPQEQWHRPGTDLGELADNNWAVQMILHFQCHKDELVRKVVGDVLEKMEKI